jgi:hypothetical protein
MQEDITNSLMACGAFVTCQTALLALAVLKPLRFLACPPFHPGAPLALEAWKDFLHEKATVEVSIAYGDAVKCASFLLQGMLVGHECTE